MLKKTENKRKVSTNKPSSKKAPAKNSSTKNSAGKNPSTRKPSSDKYSPRNSSARESPARRPSSDKYSPRKSSTQESPARRPSGDKYSPRKSSTQESPARRPSDIKPTPENPPAQKSYAKPLKEQEFTIYGWNACMAVFKNRPDDILRVFFSQERSSGMAAVKRWCQTQKLPYRELDAESLYKVAASAHHEGTVMVVRPHALQPVHGLLRNQVVKNTLLVALDRVGDTHNLGAILRTCAFFGASGLIFGNHEDQAKVTSSAARMAEGALETVPMYQSSDLASSLRDFREKKVMVVGADLGSGGSLYETEISFPCVVVVGNENQGLSEKVKKRCHALVHVPGSGNMQSLNVSVATGVILAELNRRKNRLSK